MSMRVLIVEDEIPMASLLEHSFVNEGFTTARAGDGMDCMNKLATFKPDAVVMDIMMPKLDGIEATRLSRWNRDFRDLVIVALSARSDQETRNEMRKAGADMFVCKPFVITQLVDQVKELLAARAGTI